SVDTVNNVIYATVTSFSPFALLEANSLPVAGPDSYSTNEDTALTVSTPGVLANDSDIDGDALTVAVVSGPTRGTLTFNADGPSTYPPGAACDGEGTDSFPYRADDGQGGTALATVTITIARAVADGQTTIDAGGVVRVGGTSGADTIVLTTSG